MRKQNPNMMLTLVPHVTLNYNTAYSEITDYGNTNNYSTQECKHNIVKNDYT